MRMAACLFRSYSSWARCWIAACGSAEPPCWKAATTSAKANPRDHGRCSAATSLSRALLKECLDLLFKGVFVHHACVRLGDLPVAVNKQGHRKGRESAVSAGGGF